VTGVHWDAALAYCKSKGGTLPTEEEWELAARGSERRPFAWGSQPIDLARTRAYGGKSAKLASVMMSDQDVTPGDTAHAFFDMTGNALEWTFDLYREDLPGQDESWTQADGVTFRAVRGLPMRETQPHAMPSEALAYRDSLCATGPCPPKTNDELAFVGFRCARHGGGR
jgi:formylglycine-generating enzyme required for sulfatase activity